MKLIFSLSLLASLPGFAAPPQASVSRSISQEAVLIIKDTVKKIVNTEGLEVSFQKRAAIYHLRPETKDYDSIKQALLSSQKASTSLRLRIDANTLEIKEVVPE